MMMTPTSWEWAACAHTYMLGLARTYLPPLSPAASSTHRRTATAAAAAAALALLAICPVVGNLKAPCVPPTVVVVASEHLQPLVGTHGQVVSEPFAYDWRLCTVLTRHRNGGRNFLGEIPRSTVEAQNPGTTPPDEYELCAVATPLTKSSHRVATGRVHFAPTEHRRVRIAPSAEYFERLWEHSTYSPKEQD